MTTFASVLAALTRGRVDYLVVGGLAVARAGYARTTDDLDVLVESSEPNLTRLLGVLAHFGDGSASELSPADFTDDEGCIRIAEEFDLDVFTRMSGHTYTDLLALSDPHDIDGETVRFLNAAGLIRLKRASLRPKDRLDVEALQAILRGEHF